jgi:D-3-phosphoglycerate dehydrogenase / 2-oxoglutarate reductase
MAFKVLVVDYVASCGIEYLREKGCEVDVLEDDEAKNLINITEPYDAILVRSRTQITREIIEAAPNLKIIGRAGVSIENIDIPAATEHGIIVCNAPQSNIISAAEMTMALLLTCARNITIANEQFHKHTWSSLKLSGIELYGKTLAIFGLGRVGGLVAGYAKSFGMELLAYDPYCSAERASQLGVTLCSSLDEILPKADFVSIHLPKTEETYHMLGANEFAQMKTGVVFLNVGYGGVCSEEVLANFVAAGKIGAAGIDIFEQEPCTDSPLLEFPNVILTPHIGAITNDAQKKASMQIAEAVLFGLNGSVVPTAVNKSFLPQDVVDIMSPYIPACETIGAMISSLLPKMPHTFNVTTSGKLASHDPAVLVASALQGLLSSRDAEFITAANYESVAKRRGVQVSYNCGGVYTAFSSAVTITADNVQISCMVPEDSQAMRLINFLGYDIDIVPGAHSLVLEYEDAPGRIGIIGTILGEAGVNISTMQIGTKPAEKTALVYLNVDSQVDEEVIARFDDAIENLKNSWQINL